MNALAQHLAERIRAAGPISLADYMRAATDSYYAARDPFGPGGDFVTAPEVSQMFGELIGLWCAATWQAMGAPARFVLAELGPGRGTLMADALRAARAAPEFLAGAELHLVETSELLRQRQATALADHRPRWHDQVADLPAGPAIIIANEFVDALPVRQFERRADGWHERRIGLEGDGFTFVIDQGVAQLPDAAVARDGALREVSPEATALATELGRGVARDGGAALIIDYGYETGAGETVQAVKAHRRHDLLRDPGEADVTAHVDFAALARAATAAGARIHGPVPQGEFLRRLGIEIRAARLKAAAPQHAASVAAGARRLTAPDAMGTLFKVMAIAAPHLPALAGFEAA